MTRRPAWLAGATRGGTRTRGPAIVVAPAGVGLASERARASMIDALRRAGVRDARVLAAMGEVPRHAFVDAALASRAYEEVALPIGHGQTISRPSTVARMVETLVAQLPESRCADLRVLEVGTGCGYQAAVLARVFGQVVSIERVRALHEQARRNLRALRLTNLRLVFGDGHDGVPQAAPFDAIVVAAAADSIPDALLEQMKIGARLIAPIGTTRQALHLVERVAREQWQLVVLDAVRFVPLRTGTS